MRSGDGAPSASCTSTMIDTARPHGASRAVAMRAVGKRQAVIEAVPDDRAQGASAAEDSVDPTVSAQELLDRDAVLRAIDDGVAGIGASVGIPVQSRNRRRSSGTCGSGTSRSRLDDGSCAGHPFRAIQGVSDVAGRQANRPAGPSGGCGRLHGSAPRGACPPWNPPQEVRSRRFKG